MLAGGRRHADRRSPGDPEDYQHQGLVAPHACDVRRRDRLTRLHQREHQVHVRNHPGCLSPCRLSLSDPGVRPVRVRCLAADGLCSRRARPPPNSDWTNSRTPICARRKEAEAGQTRSVRREP